jgi:hypothetical protein
MVVFRHNGSVSKKEDQNHSNLKTNLVDNYPETAKLKNVHPASIGQEPTVVVPSLPVVKSVAPSSGGDISWEVFFHGEEFHLLKIDLVSHAEPLRLRSLYLHTTPDKGYALRIAPNAHQSDYTIEGNLGYSRPYLTSAFRYADERPEHRLLARALWLACEILDF